MTLLHSTCSADHLPVVTENSAGPPSWVPTCFCGLHPLSLSLATHVCDSPAPLPLPSPDNGSHQEAQRTCIASKPGEPISSAPGLGTFVDFESSLAVCQWDTFSRVFHRPLQLLMCEIEPIPCLRTSQSLLSCGTRCQAACQPEKLSDYEEGGDAG